MNVSFQSLIIICPSYCAAQALVSFPESTQDIMPRPGSVKLSTELLVSIKLLSNIIIFKYKIRNL